MDSLDPAAPVVFLGPTLERSEAERWLPDAQYLPPVKRGDLHRARERGGALFLIVDGVFAQQLAVSPREVIDVLSDGALVAGASSMGALRAAECWPAGMRGIGSIYRLYRAGRLDSDDEVAVAIDHERGFRAITLALINLRHALSVATRRGLLDADTAARLLATARRLHFTDRTLPRICEEAGCTAHQRWLEGHVAEHDLKRRDAVRALRRMAAVAADPVGRAAHERVGNAPLGRPPRYGGPDPLLGRTRPALQQELAVWLLGSGRYQKHFWPLVAGAPELCAPIEPDDEVAPVAVRGRAAAALARLLANQEAFAAALWEELDFSDELDAEVVRLCAVQTLAARARADGHEPGRSALRAARDEVAIAHGASDWDVLVDAVSDGLLFGFVPLAWIEEASRSLALARCWRARSRPFRPLGGPAGDGVP